MSSSNSVGSILVVLGVLALLLIWSTSMNNKTESLANQPTTRLWYYIVAVIIVLAGLILMVAAPTNAAPLGVQQTSPQQTSPQQPPQQPSPQQPPQQTSPQQPSPQQPSPPQPQPQPQPSPQPSPFPSPPPPPYVPDPNSNPPKNVSAILGPGVGMATISFDMIDGHGEEVFYTAEAIPGGMMSSSSSSPIVISDLNNGINYTFVVTARIHEGIVGTSVPSNSVFIMIPNKPETPTNVVAIPGPQSATITFDNVFGADSYIISTFPGSKKYTVTSSPATITDLKNGGTYIFNIRASNLAGTSPASPMTASITLPVIPLPPAMVVATPSGDGQVTVAFSSSQEAEWYNVTSNPDNIIVSGQSNPIIVKGLKNGGTYTFTMTSTNSLGTSEPSSPSVPVTLPIPSDIPMTPFNVTVEAKANAALVSFTEVKNANLYTVTASPGNITSIGNSSPIRIDKLVSGQNYTFTVTSSNASGTSPPSDASLPILIPLLPNAPTYVKATPTADGNVSVAFTPSIGATSYTVTSYPGNLSATAATGPILMIGIAPGVAYTFTVVATNIIGSSLESPPSAPVTVTIPKNSPSPFVASPSPFLTSPSPFAK